MGAYALLVIYLLQHTSLADGEESFVFISVLVN